jgi:hypothetical protein
VVSTKLLFYHCQSKPAHSIGCMDLCARGSAVRIVALRWSNMGALPVEIEGMPKSLPRPHPWCQIAENAGSK